MLSSKTTSSTFYYALSFLFLFIFVSYFFLSGSPSCSFSSPVLAGNSNLTENGGGSRLCTDLSYASQNPRGLRHQGRDRGESERGRIGAASAEAVASRRHFHKAMQRFQQRRENRSCFVHLGRPQGDNPVIAILGCSMLEANRGTLLMSLSRSGYND